MSTRSGFGGMLLTIPFVASARAKVVTRSVLSVRMSVRSYCVRTVLIFSMTSSSVTFLRLVSANLLSLMSSSLAMMVRSASRESHSKSPLSSWLVKLKSKRIARPCSSVSATRISGCCACAYSSTSPTTSNPKQSNEINESFLLRITSNPF